MIQVYQKLSVKRKREVQKSCQTDSCITETVLQAAADRLLFGYYGKNYKVGRIIVFKFVRGALFAVVDLTFF